MARRAADAILNFFEYGIDSASRTLYLGSFESDPELGESGVDSAMADRLIKGVHLLDQSPYAPITVKMNNPGGDCYHGLAIYDALTLCQSEITIQVYGMAMSMGLIVLQSADYRLLAPNATLMWHPGSDGYVGHAIDFQRRAEEDKRLGTVMDAILLPKIREKRPTFTQADLTQKFAFDFFMSASDAVTWGLADSILE